MANLINAERATVTHGTRTLLDAVSLGVDDGDRIGVVGRNGDGKTTLLRILTGERPPDSGRVTHTAGLSIGYLHQTDDFSPDNTVREVIVGGRADHVWAAEAVTRSVVEHLLGDVDLDARVATLSGGERRRAALSAVLLGRHDVLVLDEPTNHLDVEAIGWLAEHLCAQPPALVVVSHDRWFLDAVCTRTWEVHDGAVDAYDGGYAAYVLARIERMRIAAGTQARRRNLMRKELAWLRRGAPARTSKPRFRVQAANALIADEPPPRDSLALQRLATTRLGKDVFDLHHVTLGFGGRTIVDGLDWSIGPGARIGLVGVNGSGKTTLLRLLAGELSPAAGRIKSGATLRLGYLSQNVTELRADDRVLDAVEHSRRVVPLAGGREISASTLLEDFGFRGDKLSTRVGELSGGERRRLQFLRLLLDEPNVLLLDEPTNDLDIDTLTVIEDFLDGWPGTLIVVTHDRYFLERVTDVTYALSGDGRCELLPGGIEQYLASRQATLPPPAAPLQRSESPAARSRRTGKEMARIEGQLEKLDRQIVDLHERMAAAAQDHVRLGELTAELDAAERRKDDLEEAWLAAADD